MRTSTRFLPLLLVTALAAAGAALAPRSKTPHESGGATPPAPLSLTDPDAAALLPLAERAANLARATVADPVLRQVDTDLTLTAFHFTDPVATLEVAVVIHAPGEPPESWETWTAQHTKLTGHESPPLRLEEMRAGPVRAAQTITSHWPGCELRTMTLYLSDGNLTWTIFCNTAEGVVSGDMDALTGRFTPSAAPPAPPPPTALPLT